MHKADLDAEIEALPQAGAAGRGEADRPLRVLQVEDDDNDALLCQYQLQKAGFSLETEVVTSRKDFVAALRSRLFDIVITDYKLPGWSGLEVLTLLKEDARDIPCILVTGSIGEEIAATCMKRGATDYISKDRPTRLPFAISSALLEKEERLKRKEAERSRNRLASIVEFSLDAIVGAGQDGRIVSWNPAAVSTFGRASADVLGSAFSSLFTWPSWPALQGLSHFEGTAETEPGVQRYEAQGAGRNGETMDLAVTISPIFKAGGAASGFSAIIRDVTQAKRQQRELLTTQKLEAIGQLAGGIAHDFNNLLTVINGYARMLQRKESADPAKVSAILEAGERGQRLTKQLLLFSRKQITQLKPVSLNLLVLGFMDMLRPLIGAEVELRTQLTPELGEVMVDTGQMEQVIMNLVVNARDAMPGGGTIQIETRYLAAAGRDVNDLGTVVLSVSDTGTGMSPEVQARIFEPFFTTKEVGRGTGLGLSTTSGIVTHCKGKLRVASQLGQGTTFTIELPACGPAAAESHLPPGTDQSAAAGSGTILLAEDDPTVREFMRTVLQDEGYRVLAAENGSQALEICKNHAGPLHALVSDVVMPEINGRTLAEKARALRPDLPVLFVSGYVDRGLQDDDILQPGYSFLQKPFTAGALLRQVAESAAVAVIRRNDSGKSSQLLHLRSSKATDKPVEAGS